MKKFIIFLSTVCLCMTCFGQTKAIVKIADRISIKNRKTLCIRTNKNENRKRTAKRGIGSNWEKIHR